MIGLAPRTTRVSQQSLSKGASVSLECNLETQQIQEVTITSLTRPITAVFFNTDGTVRHTITHPAGTVQTYDVTGPVIAVTEFDLVRPDATHKYFVAPRHAMYW